MCSDGNIHPRSRTGPTAADVPHKGVAGEEVGSKGDDAWTWRGDALHRLGQAAGRLDAGHRVKLEAGQGSGCGEDEVAAPALDARFECHQHETDEAERHPW